MQFISLLKNVWNYIDNLNSRVKTVFLVVFIIGILFVKLDISLDTFKNNFIQYQIKAEKQYDKKVMKTNVELNQLIDLIQVSDSTCSNVLLLNYHNSKKSLQGYRYTYLNCIYESPKNPQIGFVSEFWKEIQCIENASEIDMIHRCSPIEITANDILFPRISRRLQISGVEKGIFYSLEGEDIPVGMVVILYKDKNQRYIGKNLFQRLQKISMILNVNGSNV